MNTGFRDYLDLLLERDEVQVIDRPIDLRYASSLAAQTVSALWFRNLPGYRMSVITGLFRTRKRLAIALDLPDGRRLGQALDKALANRLQPIIVGSAPVSEVVLSGEELDLASLPLPVVAVEDGAPYITSGVTIVRDPEFGLNAGIYRLMLVDQTTLAINPSLPSNLYTILKRAQREGRSVQVSVSIGVHPRDMLAAGYRSPLGDSELNIAGALRGEPLELAMGYSVEVPCIANSEIVIEGQIAPDPWTHDEGRFGEFHRFMGELRQNPVLKVSAIRHRYDAILYALHMPWENIWLTAPAYEAIAWRILRQAGLEIVDVNVTPGGCCHWHVVAAIRKKPGEGKNALAALLSVGDFKHAVVTDPDIDIYDPSEVEWAIATRVQADRDLLIIPGARAKPSDPSLPTPTSTMAKIGIDATIPEYARPGQYNPIRYPYAGKLLLEDVISNLLPSEASVSVTIETLCDEIVDTLTTEPMFYAEVLAHFEDKPYRTVIQAMCLLRSRDRLLRDAEGRYLAR